MGDACVWCECFCRNIDDGDECECFFGAPCAECINECGGAL